MAQPEEIESAFKKNDWFELLLYKQKWYHVRIIYKFYN